MIACLILLASLLVVGTVLRLLHKPEADGRTDSAPVADGECCGTHAVCEKINSARLAPVEYYDDEELDRFAGRQPDDYSAAEVDEFREILCTLLPADVAGWGASLEKRNIHLPVDLRDEFLIMLNP